MEEGFCIDVRADAFLLLQTHTTVKAMLASGSIRYKLHFSTLFTLNTNY
jgi:hypothetical protein